MAEPARLLWPSVGALYNAMHEDGWRWETLTSGEQAAEAAKIEPVLQAIADLNFDVKRIVTEVGRPVEKTAHGIAKIPDGPRIRPTIEHHHHALAEGFVCPENGHFVVVGHFLDRGCMFGHPREAHRPALQVFDTYVYNPEP